MVFQASSKVEAKENSCWHHVLF